MDYFEILYIVYGFGAGNWRAFVIAGGIFLAVHVLQGIGLLFMARRANIRGGEILAFVPFFNSYLIGRLAGECSVFGKKIPRCGIFYALIELLCCAATALSVTAEYLLEPYLTPIGNMLYDYTNVPASLQWAETLGTVMVYVQPLLQLVYIFFLIVVLFAFFRKYAARYSLLFAFCSAIVPVKGAFIFAVRKNVPVDYESYMRAQRDAYYRGRRYYDGRDPYGRPPYDDPRTPPYGDGSGAPSGEDPFREFSQNAQSGQDRTGRTEADGEDRSENDEFFGKS